MRLDLEPGPLDQRAATPPARARRAPSSSPRRGRAPRGSARRRSVSQSARSKISGLALEPAPVRLGDVVRARREDVEDEAAVGLEQLARSAERAQASSSVVQVEERAERARDEPNALGHGWCRAGRRRAGRPACATPAPPRPRRRPPASPSTSRRRSRARLPPRSARRSARCRRRARPPARPHASAAST